MRASRPEDAGEDPPAPSADEPPSLRGLLDNLGRDVVQVVANSPVLRNLIGAGSRNAWNDYAGGLVNLRNDVMHPEERRMKWWTKVLEWNRRGYWDGFAP